MAPINKTLSAMKTKGELLVFAQESRKLQIREIRFLNRDNGEM